jgi:hypothetical protein
LFRIANGMRHAQGGNRGKIRFAANERKLTRISKVVDYSLPYHCQGEGGFQFYQKAIIYYQICYVFGNGVGRTVR